MDVACATPRGTAATLRSCSSAEPVMLTFVACAASGLQHDRARAGPTHPDFFAKAELILIPARAIGPRNSDQPAVIKQNVEDRNVAEIRDLLDLSLGDVARPWTVGDRGWCGSILVQVHLLGADRDPHGGCIAAGHGVRHMHEIRL